MRESRRNFSRCWDNGLVSFEHMLLQSQWHCQTLGQVSREKCQEWLGGSGSGNMIKGWKEKKLKIYAGSSGWNIMNEQ